MAYRICPVCEAACGLKLDVQGRQVIAIEPNREDVFSRGHACAKGLALRELDEDSERVRRPLVKVDGVFKEASWDEAYKLIQQNLKRIQETHGTNSVATYIGNPTAHNIGLSMGLGMFLRGLGSTNIYSAGSVDQLPKQLACELMFGNDMAIPVPDIEHCDYLLMLGANPVVSNGSLWVVPKFRDHLRALQQRGGQLVTVDPRRSETARLANLHVPIKPGTDAWFLAAPINELQDLGMTMPVTYAVNGWEELKTLVSQVTLQEAAARTGVPGKTLQSIARDLTSARCAVVYGRVGTTLQQHGTLTSFLIEVVNLLTGNLDRKGGAMFPEQPYSAPPTNYAGTEYNRYQSRVSGHPEVAGQMPLAALSEEIETPGDGQVRALVTFAGNPVVSGPDSERLSKALASLAFMVSVDIYLNETTQYADVILPGSSPFEDGHYDSFLGAMGYRNAARYSPPVFKGDQPREWDIGLTFAYLLGSDAPPSESELQAFEDNIVAGAISAYTEHPDSSLNGRDVQEILGQLPESGVERLLDLGIRAGRWGDAFGQKAEGLTLARIIDEPNGIDLGELREDRLKEIVRLPGSEMQLAPAVICDDLRTMLASPMKEGFRLIGRRSTNTNNSWLHNLPMLTKGKSVCVLEVNAEDAAVLDIEDGDSVTLSTSVNTLEVTARVTDEIASGVVSLPHGFTRDVVMVSQAKGANYNSLVDTGLLDQPSRTAALNGIPVSVQKIK